MRWLTRYRLAAGVRRLGHSPERVRGHAALLACRDCNWAWPAGPDWPAPSFFRAGRKYTLRTVVAGGSVAAVLRSTGTCRGRGKGRQW